LLDVEGTDVRDTNAPAPPALQQALDTVVGERLNYVDARNAELYEEEATKLDRWAEDLKLGLEAELKELDREIREATKAARAAVSLREKLDAQKRVRTLEQKRTQKRRSLYEAQDDVDRQRNALIEELEQQLGSNHEIEEVFVVEWSLTT
jgi:adenine-specific DNA-methyltransferase